MVAVGLLGLVVAKDRPVTDLVDGRSTAPTAPPDGPSEPAVFPVVGDQAGPTDFGHLSTIVNENPDRVSALIARLEGDTLRDSLWITATASTSTTVAPTSTATASPGVETLDVHGRRAEVWTERFEVPVQHVRFDGSPTLEIAGVDALAFMQSAGPEALRVGASDTNAFTLEIGDLPDGYELIVEPFREPRGVTMATISVGGTETSDGVIVAVELSNPLPVTAAYNTTLTAVDINGRPGWVGSGAGHSVIWEPTPGTFATAGGTNSSDQSIALARSVRFVDRATWMNFYGVEEMPPPAEELPPTSQPDQSAPTTMPTTDATGGQQTVPDVRGLQVADATRQLDAANIAWQVVETPHNDVPFGLVASSTPDGGTTIAAGEVVTLTVSSGPATTPPTCTVPGCAAQVIVMIANASNIGGAAATLTATLASGSGDFQLTEPTNASDDVAVLDTTIIYYDADQPDTQAVAEAVDNALGGGTAILPLPPGAPPVADRNLHGAGVLVMLGRDKADLPTPAG